MNGWYSTDKRMNFIKFVVRKRLPECLPSVINVFLNTGKEIGGRSMILTCRGVQQEHPASQSLTPAADELVRECHLLAMFETLALSRHIQTITDITGV